MDQERVGFPDDNPHESSKETLRQETIYESSLCLRKRCQEEKHESKTQFLLCNDLVGMALTISYINLHPSDLDTVKLRYAHA